MGLIKLSKALISKNSVEASLLFNLWFVVRKEYIPASWDAVVCNADKGLPETEIFVGSIMLYIIRSLAPNR